MEGSLVKKYEKEVKQGQVHFANHLLYFARSSPDKPYLECIYNAIEPFSNYFPYHVLYCNPYVFEMRRDNKLEDKKAQKDVLYITNKHSYPGSWHIEATDKLFQLYSTLAPLKKKTLDTRLNTSIPFDEGIYKGLCWDPDFLAQYRFVIFAEEDLLLGYFTDRLISVYLSGALPVCFVKEWTFTQINEHAGIFGTHIDDLPRMLDKLFNLTENEILAMRGKPLFKADLESQILVAENKIEEILERK